MSQPEGDTAGPPEMIYIIRHAEKPDDPSCKPHGVDFEGVHSKHCLLPRGWQRSGALTTLFDPALGPLQAGLATPATLLCPSYGGPDKTGEHRAYQTIQGLADRLDVPIVSPFIVGHEDQLAASLVSDYSGVVLICWEHVNIPALAGALPDVPGTEIPGKWPDDRFDVIWAFKLAPGPTVVRYSFTQIPQQLLSGDTDTVIAAP
jgi:hypothetical protein